MLYGHLVQDAIPCQKSLLARNWHDNKLLVDRKVARKKKKLKKHYNRGAKPLTQLKVGDLVCEQNINPNSEIDMAELWMLSSTTTLFNQTRIWANYS